ncbi:hypothetical protein BG261_08930 [Floricoccus tropicus]|uniref:Beta-lactamase-related domain-containing protein n=1 Tax=Floricoccus tropicus TaxID=1859473 RepID=A0A1E8GPR0_9LACT|nr:serine hydrolase domain-containing protein [Floricoccus tropicus]OFI50235.1 hypothetical protein BG261_08930 [Floricoccus tropicus]
MKKELKNHLEKLHQLEEKYNFNGAVSITDDKNLLDVFSLGYSDIENQIPFTSNTKSCIGSLTKQFTALAIMLLVEEDKIKLDQLISDFFPSYPYSNQITIRMLLNMTSGIPDYVIICMEERKLEANTKNFSEEEQYFFDLENDEKDYQYDTKRVLDIIGKHQLNFSPESKFEYSNSNYFLLGDIIEQVSNTTYSDYISENIFNKLAMKDSSCYALDAEAESYLFVDNKLRKFSRQNHSGADGSIVSTIADLSIWAQAILNHEILSEESWKEIFNLKFDAYGFGWFKLGDWFYHGGLIKGYQAEIFISFEARIAMLMLYNLERKPEIGQVAMDKEGIWRSKLLEILKIK